MRSKASLWDLFFAVSGLDRCRTSPRRITVAWDAPYAECYKTGMLPIFGPHEPFEETRLCLAYWAIRLS